ncbi:family 5 carbohydrate esterase [Colletotrichum tofieldiae]|nr:family 5 carbohydrate esterase [Colletotrichum tofieldiae]GKT81245.1 family 5 carbohydrate esterase [Colletotrichum tofieldiae]
MFQTAIECILVNGAWAFSLSFDQKVTSGEQNTVDIIKDGLKNCPNQKLFLFGYSQVATVVQNALDKMDDSSAAEFSGVVMFGNPYRIPVRHSNLDSQGRPDNRTAFGLFATQANQSIPT